MYDVIVVGAGPSGISSAIYAKRGGLNVLVLYNGVSQVEKADKIDNYYGFVDGITGEELYKNGIKQAQNLGIDVKNQEVLDIEMQEDFKYNVKTKEETYNTKSLIIATGNKRTRPNIKGILEFEGKGISYCAICDGFFYRGKNVVVIGNGDFAVNEAKHLANVVNSIKILTNGLEMPNNEFETDTRIIKEIHGENKVQEIEFVDGSKIDVDGIFIAEGIAGGVNFAKKLGIAVDNENIIVNESMETNIKGIYACGNLTGGLLQINKAAYEGAKAGLAAIKYVKNFN